MKHEKQCKQYFIQLSDDRQYPYQLNHSSRAKRLSIKLSVTRELKVTLPQGVKKSLAHAFVQKKSSWVEKQINQQMPKPQTGFRPKQLDLKMLNEQWSIEYKKGAKGSIEYSEQPQHHLLITGDIESKQLINKIIGLFLKNKARLPFSRQVDKIASEYGFQYTGLTVRGQKTRWGSCSSRKKLNLNYKLLLMPEAVVRSVFIHELCHTIEMNHSANFWKLVKKYDPEHRLHQQYLKENGSIIRHF